MPKNNISIFILEKAKSKKLGTSAVRGMKSSECMALLNEQIPDHMYCTLGPKSKSCGVSTIHSLLN